MDRHRVSLEKHLQSAKDQHRTGHFCGGGYPWDICGF
jgi:hypothetical protein